MQKISEILGYSPIDIHSHFDHGVKGDYTDIRPEIKKNVITIELEKLKRRYDIVGIDRVCFSTYSSVLRDDRIVEENDYLFEMAQNNDWIYQWVVVNPNVEDTFIQAEKMLKDKNVLGIKIHPVLHNYKMADEGDKLLSFANDLGATVLMHHSEIPFMPTLADKYPNMNLIIAHLADEPFIDAVANAKHGNIFVDTSGAASSYNNVIEHTVKRVGAEHVLFGTDSYSPAFQLGRIAWADISESDKKKILLDNAKTLFPNCF